MAKKKISREDLVLIALRLSEGLGWSHLTLRDISQEAGITLAALHEHFEDKTDILVALGRMIDRKVLENIGEMDESLSPRDRLFDVLMERYDVINEFRPGLLSILDSFKLDPKEALISLPYLCKSMSWMMETASLHTNGWRGAVQIAGLTAIYIKGLRAWKHDDSSDLAKVMASLDRDLGRAENLANMLGV